MDSAKFMSSCYYKDKKFEICSEQELDARGEFTPFWDLLGHMQGPLWSQEEAGCVTGNASY
jgi:hypothetical protein